MFRTKFYCVVEVGAPKPTFINAESGSITVEESIPCCVTAKTKNKAKKLAFSSGRTNADKWQDVKVDLATTNMRKLPCNCVYYGKPVITQGDKIAHKIDLLMDAVERTTGKMSAMWNKKAEELLAIAEEMTPEELGREI